MQVYAKYKGEGELADGVNKPTYAQLPTEAEQAPPIEGQ